MDYKTIAGGSLAVGAVAACWNFLRDTAWKLMSLFVCRAYLYNEIPSLLMARFRHDFRQYALSDHSYSIMSCYVRSLKTRRSVIYEFLNDNTQIFWKGVLPIFIREIRRDGGLVSGNSPASAGGPGRTCITFLRGTIDLEKVLGELGPCCTNDGGTGGFRVTRLRGYAGNSNRTGSEGKAVSPSSSGPMADEVSAASRYLHYKIEDLGEEPRIGDAAFSALAFPSEVDAVRHDLEMWLKSKDWYLEKRIPWRRGWGFHGKPGTGKTSLAKALAQSVDLPIMVFDIGSMSNEEFSDNWFKTIDAWSPCIVLLEDFDAVFQGRKNVVSEHSVTFDCFLNTVSGVVNSDGIFLIITTNHPELLDPALGIPEITTSKDGLQFVTSSRPGRLDRMLELKVPDEACLRQIAQRILSDCPDMIESTVAAGIGESGAQFQERCAQIALQRYWEKPKLVEAFQLRLSPGFSNPIADALLEVRARAGGSGIDVSEIKTELKK